MARSDQPVSSLVDDLLDKARNQSSAGCRVEAALNRLDPVTADKLRTALLEPKPGNPKMWAYVGARLADAICTLVPGASVTADAVSGYRAKHRG